MSKYKPEGYSTVSPYLIVGVARATIDFLKRAFGAVELRRFADKGGKLKHDEDKRGGVRDAGGTTWWIATKMA